MASDRKNLGLMDIFINPMKVTLKQFFKSTFGKPTTVMYPLEKRDPPPTYRGMNAVIWDLCIGCGICGEVCPNKCLKMKPVDLSEEEQDKAWYGSVFFYGILHILQWLFDLSDALLCEY